MYWPNYATVNPGREDAALPPTMRHGLAPETLSPGRDMMLRFLYAYLPEPPASTASSLCCAADGDGVDRVSGLPDDLLRRVVSCLPAKDGARTAALSSRWRRLWRSAPLVLVDAHLLPGGGAEGRPSRAGAASRAVADAVSAALEAHPGLFPFVSLPQLHGRHRPPRARALVPAPRHKGRRRARLRQPPLAPPQPPPPFRALQLHLLRRLYIGAWAFPDTATLPRGAAFPNLRELVLGCVVMEDKDLDFLLAASPALEILAIVGSQTQLQARLANQSLRCAQFCLSILDEVAVAVEDDPCLERLFFWRSKMSTAVKIGHAPQLRLLGYLEPGVHMLQIGNTIIEDRTQASPRTTVASIQMLALHLHFGVCSEVKMLPSFLRCFPNVETLIVESEENHESTSNLSPKFWQATSPIECVQSHLKTLVSRELQGKQSEFDFLMFIAENARILEKMIIVLKNGVSYTAREVVAAKVMALNSANWAIGDSKLLFSIRRLREGGSAWSLKVGSDFSFHDPFLAASELKCARIFQHPRFL